MNVQGALSWGTVTRWVTTSAADSYKFEPFTWRKDKRNIDGFCQFQLTRLFSVLLIFPDSLGFKKRLGSNRAFSVLLDLRGTVRGSSPIIPCLWPDSVLKFRQENRVSHSNSVKLDRWGNWPNYSGMYRISSSTTIATSHPLMLFMSTYRTVQFIRKVPRPARYRTAQLHGS